MTDADPIQRLRHDLSNPLSALLAEAQLLLLNESKLDPETLASVREIESLALRMRYDPAGSLTVASPVHHAAPRGARSVPRRGAALVHSPMDLARPLVAESRVRSWGREMPPIRVKEEFPPRSCFLALPSCLPATPHCA
jgi:hypothetical protein